MFKAGILSTLILCLTVTTSVTADPKTNETEQQSYRRRETPIVKAVRKVRDSIVTIKVVKPRASKDVVGTGVIIDERGYVVTNYHVVQNYTRVKVYLRDGTYLPCTVYSEIASHDLAVLKVESKAPLQALRLGPASDLMVGETVIAIGHPYGYTNTVSTGIISATGRQIVMPSNVALTNLIQTTADINPGNSGGALLNINGELIGINVALRKDAQGIAFALNADSVQKVLSRHLSAAKISGLRHGLYCREKVEESIGPVRQKLVIDEVTQGNLGASAGLRQGDVIVSVGEKPIWNRFDLERALWKVGENTIPIQINRRGLSMTLKLPARETVVSHR